MNKIERFANLKSRVLSHPRIQGIYILEAAPVPALGDDAFVQEFAARFGFAEPDVGAIEWKHAEVFREEAREELVTTLIGGLPIGHSRPDVPPAQAERFADDFLGLFEPEARFYIARPPTGQAQSLAPYAQANFFDFIFGGGCIAHDAQFAAIFWMLDND